MIQNCISFTLSFDWAGLRTETTDDKKKGTFEAPGQPQPFPQSIKKSFLCRDVDAVSSCNFYSTQMHKIKLLI